LHYLEGIMQMEDPPRKGRRGWVQSGERRAMCFVAQQLVTMSCPE
jgi:hypothetical protein